MASIRLSELAARLGQPLAGATSQDPLITGISTLEEATASQISFLADPKYIARAQGSAAAALLALTGTEVPGKPTITFDSVWEGVLAVIEILHPAKRFAPGIHPTAVVDPSATLGEAVSVQPRAVIEAGAKVGPRTVIEAGVFVGERAEIGADCHLMPHAVVMRACRLGDRVILQPGTVIGADGFKYEFLRGRHVKIPQIGVVVIEDDVEIGANACVDRASFTETRIGRGTKIDNLVQIAHNDRIGQHCIIVSQVGLSGSVKVGDGAILAGQVGCADNVTIGSRAVIGAQSGIHKDVPEGAQMFGTPAGDGREFMKIVAAWQRLPRALEDLRKLRAKVEDREKKSG
jgi:UDP-3-O-[3-hydroxymyristoyl] glucosamine N-acyltransferase